MFIMLRVKRKAYIRKGGTKVKATSFKIKDRGAPGRTPKSKQFYHPKVHSGWSKDMPMAERRRLALRAHKGNYLSAARSLQALSNVTTDKTTKQKAAADAKYFFNLNKSKK